MKTTWSVLFSLLLLVPSAAQAQYGYSTNADGSIYTYNTNADGSINFAAYSGPPWAVTIPSTINGVTVTSIGPDAFQFLLNLTSVIIPFGVTSIGEKAFEICLSLTNVAIPDSVTTIGDHAFAAVNLSSVTIPASVTNLGAFAFAGSNLTTITVDPQNPSYSSMDGVVFDKSGHTLRLCPQGAAGNYNIPGGVTNIGPYAFWGCVALTNVVIPGSVTSIGEGAFGVCDGLTSVTIPGSVTNIQGGAFFNCGGLTNLTFLNGVGIIWNNTFSECTNLTSITIPSSVTNIGDSAFGGCTSLANVTIPAGVTTLVWLAFADCQSLAGVNFLGNAPTCDTNVFNYDTNVTVYYLPGATGWSNTFAGVPALLWNPMIQTGDGGFGARNHQFGFNITNSNNVSVVVETCTNLACPVWLPLRTVTLTNGSFYFSEPVQPNASGRFYGLGLP